MNAKIAKQTVRIKAPVTSELLKEKISGLKNVTSKKERTPLTNLFRSNQVGRSYPYFDNFNC